MKLIFLTFLFSLSAFAQYRVEIKKQGKLTNAGTFETLEEANTWLEQGKKEHWFARPAKFESKCDKTGLKCKEVEIEPAEPFEVIGPIDISQEVQAEKTKQDRKKLAKERLKNFDLNKLDSATTIKGLREMMKEVIHDVIEARD